MFKVIVAEDELFILKTIKRMIEDAHLGFTVVGDAYNGEIALQKINELKPDVVFTDIRMPIMDGITLISKIRESNPDIIIVILSGYQEFDYAKQALKHGVHDYLLKPLSPIALEDLLKNIYNKLYLKKKERQLRVLRQLVSNINTSTSYDSCMLNELFKYDGYLYMLTCAGSYCTFSCSWLTAAKEFWCTNDLTAILTNEFTEPDSNWVLDGEHGNEKIIIAGFTGSYAPMKNKLVDLHNLFSSKGFPITSVIHYAGSKISDIGSFLHISRTILNKSIQFAGSCLIDENESIIPSDSTGTVLPDGNTGKLLDILLRNNQIIRFKQELLKLFNFCEMNSFKQLKLERLLKHILGMFYTSIDVIPENRAVELDMEINELISNSTSYKSLYDGFCVIIEDLFRLKNNSLELDDNQSVLVEKIEQYLKTNFSRQINLQSLSNHFNVTPQYLSRVYRRIKGMSPSDYIIELRIEKSKELLMINPPVVLKEIADAVGFNDPFYLSKVFKSVTGKSPSEFRAYASSI